MGLSPLAGKPAPAEILIDVDRLLKQYVDRKPDVSDPQQRVSFGTSGHRGTPLNGSFNEAHIVAMTQADRPEVREAYESVKEEFKELGIDLRLVSAVTHDGLEALMLDLFQRLETGT